MVATRRGGGTGAVASAETAVATKTKQTPSPPRKSRRIAARHDTSTPTPPKKGDADGKIDVPRPPNGSTNAAVCADASAVAAEASARASSTEVLVGDLHKNFGIYVFLATII